MKIPISRIRNQYAILAVAWIAMMLFTFGGCTNRRDAPSEPESRTQKDPPEEAVARSEQVTPTSTYRLPSKEVIDVVDAAPFPHIAVSPDGRRIAQSFYPSMPTIEQLAEPLLGLAGRRINPRRTETRRTVYYRKISILRVADGQSIDLAVPEGSRIGPSKWSPDSEKLAFTITAEEGVELWVADASTGKPRRLTSDYLNGTLGSPFRWIPDNGGGFRLLARLNPNDRGPVPRQGLIPEGPLVSETANRKAANRTYQDLLDSTHDERLFEYYFTSQLATIELDGTVNRKPIQGICFGEKVSPDGKHLLVTRLHRPFSRVVPYYWFSRRIEVWPLTKSDPPFTVAELPVAEEVPIEGVTLGLRRAHWIPTEPASLVWVEALDEGNPRNEVPHRDRLLRAAPFHTQPEELARLTHRYRRIDWLELRGRYLVTEYDRDRRWTTTHLKNADDSNESKVIFDRSVHDAYRNPGRPVTKQLDNGQRVVAVPNGHIYLKGSGASPAGDRPFLDRLHLQSGRSERVFHSPEDAYASFVDFASLSDGGLIIRQEALQLPPNLFYVAPDKNRTALTHFKHPYPQFKDIQKQLLTYRRKDGVSLSGTLYLPPGYEKDVHGKLPLLVWAYPQEFNDARTAAQVRAAPTKFTRLTRTSSLLFLTQGYAVLYGASMPVVGDPETMNDTLIPQLVDSAEAAIDAVDNLGVIDRNRVGIGGHSYGAFMTANLLAHSDLFRAGIARSGAYNRSFTPFGFQNERRTLWEATDAYIAVSPLFSAEKINEPLLLIHGEIDNNAGTYPIQSKRLFHAMSGLGGHAKLVLLPYESHVYRGRESVLHVLAESFEWLDRHLKSNDT